MASPKGPRGSMWAVLVAAAALLGVLAATSPTAADLYFNSSEAGCDGSNPSVLFCDDFEDGDWFATTGGPSLVTDGWGNIVIGSTPTAVCGGQGAVGTNCAAISRFSGRTGADNDGAHSFKDRLSYREI